MENKIKEIMRKLEDDKDDNDKGENKEKRG